MQTAAVCGGSEDDPGAGFPVDWLYLFDRIMLKNAAWLALFVYGLTAVVFVLLLGPAAFVAYLLPGAWSAAGFAVALLFAWSLKAALLEPFAVACLMQVYFKTIAGQRPDPEWEARLEQMSGKFRKLKDRITARPAAAAQASPAPRPS